MSRVRLVVAALSVVFTLSAVIASSASAGWFIGGEELAAGNAATLATTAKVSTAIVLNASSLKVKVACKSTLLHGESPEIVGTETLKAKSLTFEGCVTTEPASGCALEKSSIVTLPLNATMGSGSAYPDVAITFKAQTKKTLATILFSEKNICAFEGEQPLTGAVTLNAPTLQEELSEQPIEGLGSTENNSLEMGGTKTYLEKGKTPLKLAAGERWFFVPAPPAPRLAQVDFTNNLSVNVDHRADMFGEKGIEIKEYEGKGGEGKDAVEWKSPKVGEVKKNWPIAYVQNTKVKLVVQLALEVATQEFLEKKIEGEPVLTGEGTFGGVALKFEKKFNAAAIKANKGFLTTGEIESTNALPAKVLYALTAIAWKWEYKEKGAAATKVKLGNSTHNLYTTFKMPGKEIYLTLLDLDTLGIEKEAALNEKTAIAGAWRGFSTFEGVPGVPSVHIRTYNPATATGELDHAGKVLEYYGEIVKPKKTLAEVYKEEITNSKRAVACDGVREMLENGKGRCGVWAKTWVEALGTEGIGSEEISLFSQFGAAKTPCATALVCVMLVKNWSFGIAAKELPFPYETSQVTDEEGAPGQGVKNPPPFFWDHVIVKAGPKGSAMLYDPSYGTGPFPGTESVEPTETSVLEEYQKKSIDGYCRSTKIEQEEAEKGEKVFAKPSECQTTPPALELTPAKGFEFP